MWGIITTWRIAAERIERTAQILESNGTSGDVIETTIKEVEDFPYYKSVDYGSLLSKEIEVELDAIYMDGTTFDIRAATTIEDFAGPISIVRQLSKENISNLLVDEGVEKFIHKEGFERENMLSDHVRVHYKNRVKDVQELEIKPYSEYDMVGMVCPDGHGNMTATTSTSGLFMKEKDRVGDSPISGSGFYADSRAGDASATGLGEDLIRRCISYEIVRLMKEEKHPQEAYDITVSQLDQELTKRRGKMGDISLVAMNNKGEWGVAANIEGFPFAVATQTQKPIAYVIEREHRKYVHEGASNKWLESYMSTRMAPLIEKQHGG